RGWDAPDTQVTPRELELLTRFGAVARVIVELGSYEGSTSVALALTCPGTVYSIDPFPGGRLRPRYGWMIATRHRARQGASNLVYIKGLSFDVAPRFPHTIDLLFIDADHSFESVARD